MKKEFTIKLTYFKPSGKYYSDSKYKGEFESCGENGDICYMYDVIDWIDNLRKTDQPAPGLSDSGKDFFMVIESENGFPCLIWPYGASNIKKQLMDAK